LIKKIKSFSVVDVSEAGADAVTAVKLADDGALIEVVVFTKFFLKYSCSASTVVVV
jgi:hypothetical protein